MPSTPPVAERILVVGNGFVGDTVLGVPFFRNLRRRFPGAVIDVLIEPGAAAVLAFCPYKNELIAWPRPPRARRLLPAALARIPAQAAWLRARGYTRAYLFKRSFSSALLVRLAGIPWRVGHAGEGRGWLFSRAVPVQPARHQAEAYLDLLRADGIEIDDAHNENWRSPRDLAVTDPLVEALPAGRALVFLALRSTNPAKHWPLDRWAALVDRLVESRGCEIVLCGGPADVPMHHELRALVRPGVARHVHDLSEKVSLRQVGGLLHRMDLCVGIDSGLPHLAASHGVPVVVLFGPTDPAQWHPWKSSHQIVRAPAKGPAGSRSMDDIAIDDVLAATASLLDDPAAAMPAGRPPRFRRESRSTTPIGS